MLLFVANIINPMSLLKDYDLFIFDWDGTLSTSTFIVTLSRIFQRRYDPKYVKRHEEKYRKTVANAEIRETKGRYLASLYDAYVSIWPPHMKENSVDILKKIGNSGKRVTLFSDSKSYRLTAELRLLNALDYFDFVLSASTVGRYKPDPTGILTIIEKYKVPKNRCIYFGDTASDALAAKFAGIDSCLVGDGLENYSKLVAVEPTYIYKNLDGLLHELQK